MSRKIHFSFTKKEAQIVIDIMSGEKPKNIMKDFAITPQDYGRIKFELIYYMANKYKAVFNQ